MKRIIFLLFLLDIILKLYMYIPIVNLTINCLITIRIIFIVMRKLLHYPINNGNRFEKKAYIIMFLGIYSFLFLIILIFYINKIITMFSLSSEIQTIIFLITLTIIYITLILFFIYVISYVEEIISVIRIKINYIIKYSLVIIIILIFTEALSAVTMYYSSFQGYISQEVNERIDNLGNDKDSRNKLLSDLVIYNEKKAISNERYLFYTQKLKKSYEMIDEDVPIQLEKEILKSESKGGEQYILPSFDVFLVLFKFSFYQHYVLDLNDELSDFQKYIATYGDTSIYQMVHMLFIKLVDLIIIGKIVSGLLNRRNDESLDN